jgi:ribonucleoside-diphosphate reductase alpha chain
MSIKVLREYTRYAKYAKYDKVAKRRETWEEQVNRVFGMHEEKFKDKIATFKEEFDFAKEMVNKKLILGSQRALQFGGIAILNKEARLYNCTVSYADRPRFFQETLWLLLCGCGVGFSVQKHHIAKLPEILPRANICVPYTIPDTIEGWSDALGILINSYFRKSDSLYPEFSQNRPVFIYKEIRPAGAPLSWGGKAPGPDGLKSALEKIEALIDRCLADGKRKLSPIDVYDIIMHASDAVLSGGIRRSATICLFSADDTEMVNAKTGDWFIKNPQRGRSNNSAILIRNKTTKEQFGSLMKSVREFGEPGFVWADDTEALYNPCVEIGMRAYDEQGNSGWQFCNLCEINMKKCKTEKDFLLACRGAAILGTLQAAYDNFPYLGEVTNRIVKREALLGVSMTGMMDSPEIAFDPEIQKKGAKEVLRVNEQFAPKVGINVCARATCVKPAGSTSCLLGTASGIHPHHARRYFRRVQANVMEYPLQYFEAHNPRAVEKSVWSNTGTDKVITFLCEVPDGARTKNQLVATELLEHVKLTQQNWIEYGTRKEACVAPWLRHNVSNTITVLPEEWDGVEKFIYDNRKWFAGISLLPASGDLDYPQAPFCKVLSYNEIVAEYGDGALFASGLIVDGQHAFNDNLWAACDCALGIGEKLELPAKPEEPSMPVKNGYTDKVFAEKLKVYTSDLNKYLNNKESYENISLKLDWTRRFSQFADRYVDGNKRKCSHLLKYVSLWKQWIDLKREYVDVDWSLALEEEYNVDVSTLGAQACSGGACEMK